MGFWRGGHEKPTIQKGPTHPRRPLLRAIQPIEALRPLHRRCGVCDPRGRGHTTTPRWWRSPNGHKSGDSPKHDVSGQRTLLGLVASLPHPTNPAGVTVAEGWIEIAPFGYRCVPSYPDRVRGRRGPRCRQRLGSRASRAAGGWPPCVPRADRGG